MDDIRYSEFIFLQKLATAAPNFENFREHSGQAQIVGLTPRMYLDMAITLLEELYVSFDDQDMRLFISRLRGELQPTFTHPHKFKEFEWENPREAIKGLLSGQLVYKLNITYRGLRRLEELRDLLRKDRILEPFGTLLDSRYFHRDLEDALRRSTDTSVSVIYSDLDKFKAINDKFGHSAGDVVMKSYLEIVRDIIGPFGTSYRGRGDEVSVIIIGQSHERVVDFAEKIRESVETKEYKFEGNILPNVTTSIGVATTPPETRTVEIESIADERNRKAKAAGKNQVIHFD